MKNKDYTVDSNTRYLGYTNVASSAIDGFKLNVFVSDTYRPLLHIETPEWSVEFETEKQSILEMWSFFETNMGKLEEKTLLIGTFGDMYVNLIKDDEIESRFFLSFTTNGDETLVSAFFTLVDESAVIFARLIKDVAEKVK